MTEIKSEKLTPMMKQYFEVKQQYPDTLVFFRLGDFYELFYDDAKIRIDRLASVSKAKKSSHKYDNNKFYSKLNTAMTIGSMVLMVLAFIL